MEEHFTRVDDEGNLADDLTRLEDDGREIVDLEES